MPYGSGKDVVCFECQFEFKHSKKLSEHIKKIHDLTPQDYTIKHFYNNKRPTCFHCETSETRYVTLGKFSKFCNICATKLASAHGKVGGKIKHTWNKDKTKDTHPTLAKFSTRYKGENNPFFNKKHDPDTIKRINDKNRHSEEVVLSIVQSANAVLLTNYTEYKTQDTLLRVSCKTCLNEDNVSLINIQRCWRCRKCYPIGSRGQLDIFSFVQTILPGQVVENSTRKVIHPYELDVWVPSKNVAIEFHGLYWHSGGKDNVVDKLRHKHKYEMCKSNGIKLLQFFSDEWEQKTDICKSMIRNALKLNTHKLNARDCDLRIISKAEAKEFLDVNHISGHTRASHHVGLVHPEHGLVGVATVRTPIQKKWGHVAELARMAFKQDCTVRGGGSKLLVAVKRYALEKGFEGVLSYAELRYGEGGVYAKAGFDFVGSTTLNYWYTDGTQRHDRFKYRAQPGKPEKQVVEEAGVRAVWGCGNNVYVFKFNKTTQSQD